MTFSSVNTIWVLLGAALVFFMQAGFSLCEAGFTRAKNTGNILMKNLMDFCIGTPCFWLFGFGIILAGEKGKRLALPNSEIMIHQPLGGARGQATDIKIQADLILRTRDNLNKILSENTGKPIDVIARDTERDNYMTAQEALDYGLVDKIFSKRA